MSAYTKIAIAAAVVVFWTTVVLLAPRVAGMAALIGLLSVGVLMALYLGMLVIEELLSFRDSRKR